MEKNLIICYGSENITINKDQEHVTLTNTEAVYLLNSLIKNLEFLITK